MDKNHLLVHLTWSILMPYLFSYLELILLKLWSYGLQMGPKLSKHPKYMTCFYQIPKFSIDLNAKSELSQVMWFGCFKTLTHRNYAICMYRWEGWWKRFKMLWYFKILENCNTFIILETFKQTLTHISTSIQNLVMLIHHTN